MNPIAPGLPGCSNSSGANAPTVNSSNRQVAVLPLSNCGGLKARHFPRNSGRFPSSRTFHSFARTTCMNPRQKPPTLDYSTPPRRLIRLPVHPLAGLSLICGILLCAGMCNWHTNPREYPLAYRNEGKIPSLLLNLFVYCGPFVLFAAMAAWTIRRRAHAHPDTRLSAIAALFFNAFVILWFARDAFAFYLQIP